MKKFCAWCGKIIPDWDLEHCLKINDNYFCTGSSCYAYYVHKGKIKISNQQLLNYTFEEV